MIRSKKLETIFVVSLLFTICSVSNAQRLPNRACTAKNNVQSGVATASVLATDLRFPFRRYRRGSMISTATTPACHPNQPRHSHYRPARGRWDRAGTCTIRCGRDLEK